MWCGPGTRGLGGLAASTVAPQHRPRRCPCPRNPSATSPTLVALGTSSPLPWPLPSPPLPLPLQQGSLLREGFQADRQPALTPDACALPVAHPPLAAAAVAAAAAAAGLPAAPGLPGGAGGRHHADGRHQLHRCPALPYLPALPACPLGGGCRPACQWMPTGWFGAAAPACLAAGPCARLPRRAPLVPWAWSRERMDGSPCHVFRHHHLLAGSAGVGGACSHALLPACLPALPKP